MKGMIVENGVVVNVAIFDKSIPKKFKDQGWQPCEEDVHMNYEQQEDGSFKAPLVEEVSQ